MSRTLASTTDCDTSDYPTEDAALVLLMRAGDGCALAALFDLYHQQVFRTAAAITRDHTMAHDIVQDAFLRLFTFAHTIDTTRPLMPWLYRVTVNLAKTAIKSQQRRSPVELVIDMVCAPIGQAPDVLAEQGEVKRILNLALQTLSTKLRVVVVLHYLNEQSIEEVAAILGLSEGTVKSRLFHARLKLKGALSHYRLDLRLDDDDLDEEHGDARSET